jgi:DNA-binding transcriptional LysR family regulator
MLLVKRMADYAHRELMSRINCYDAYHKYLFAAMNLKLAHLRTLQEVVRHGSFTRAAQARHLTQPGVSLHIRELESEVGQALVHRVGKRALPTKAAGVLLEHAARIFDELEAAAHALQQLEGVVSGRIRLGTGATASIHLLPAFLRNLRAQFPRLELIVTTGNTKEIARAVIEHELDIGLVTLPVVHRQLEVEPVFVDPLVAIAPSDHPLKNARSLTAAVLAGESMILFERGGNIRAVINEWFRANRATPHSVMEVGSAEATKKLVSAGLGLSLISRIAVVNESRTGELVQIPIKPPLSRQLAVIYRRDTRRIAPLQVVLAELKTHLRDHRRVARRRSVGRVSNKKSGR